MASKTMRPTGNKTHKNVEILTNSRVFFGPICVPTCKTPVQNWNGNPPNAEPDLKVRNKGVVSKFVFVLNLSIRQIRTKLHLHFVNLF